ncbi:rubrerythrin-like domain-containing protein [Halapricum salinum]|uniref:Rubrerythrin-like domain-containing protein n=1 Tax=Halapricum salinum TaxID=1457250 RepID=A0A4D6HJC0_9EURY|nr:rubrerythrin-like domain-containing protein [Halapricum salinum]QCC52817.1 rubrerythrin-like domain-containing protein [Halapricum salinum]
MTRADPYTPSESRYECLACGKRITAGEGSSATCPTCGSHMQNIAVPRE